MIVCMYTNQDFNVSRASNLSDNIISLSDKFAITSHLFL